MCSMLKHDKTKQDDEKFTSNAIQSQPLYREISANTWLRHIGQPQHKPDRNESPIRDELRREIGERAKSASAVLGRRHFEIEHQDLKRHEVLKGKQCPQKINQLLTIKKIDNGITNDSDLVKSNKEAAQAKPRANERPKTAYSIPRPQRRIKPSLSLPCLNIKQLLDETFNKTNTSTEDKSDSQSSRNSCMSVMDVRHQNVTILNNETISFRSVQAMREAYHRRVQSSPACTDLQCPVCVTESKQPEQQQEVVLRQTERLFTPRNRLEDFVERSRTNLRKSCLKPLLYSEDCDIQHSAGCPYACKGCFRACLASDDYMADAKLERDNNLRTSCVKNDKSKRLMPRLRSDWRLHPSRAVIPHEQETLKVIGHNEHLHDTANV